MTLGIDGCVTVEFISERIKTNKTEDYIHKCNCEDLFVNKKKDKFINITIVESTENVYCVTLESEEFFNTTNLVKNLHNLILK